MADLPGEFGLRPDASGAQVKLCWLTGDGHRSRMDIGQPATIGSAFRMAHIVAVLR